MSKKVKRGIYIGICFISGCLIGVFANQINTMIGLICFSLGVFLLVLSSINLTKS